ncbi:MAG: DNA recombination protein RmuC [Bacteroidales bacterium]|nr:DNA recombination protein RmuC [Bacteroidales bacterium]
MEIIYISFGLLLGVFATYFVLKNRFKSSEKLFVEKETLLMQTLNEQKTALAEKENILFELNGKYNSKLAEYKNLEERFSEHKNEVEGLKEKFTIEFKNLANEILEEKSKRFTEQNKTNITDILKPLGEKIKEFEKKVEEVYDKEAQQRFSLKEEVKRLAELNQQVSKEAHNLTRALKGESKTQGMWGEIVLENILEKSGLVKDREYFIQESFRTIEGRRLQPDVILKYPGDRNVIIDSKVSLTAYERYVSAEDEGIREAAKRDHMTSVKTTFRSSAQKITRPCTIATALTL